MGHAIFYELSFPERNPGETRMLGNHEVDHLAIWIMSGVQIAGLLSACLVRWSVGSRGQTSCQCLFLACLGLVGLATMIAIGFNSGTGVLSGSTLTVMVLTAVWDIGGRRATESVL